MKYRDMQKITDSIMFEAVNTAPGNVGKDLTPNPTQVTNLNQSSGTPKPTEEPKAQTTEPGKENPTAHAEALKKFLAGLNGNEAGKAELKKILDGILITRPGVAKYIKEISIANIDGSGKGLFNIIISDHLKTLIAQAKKAVGKAVAFTKTMSDAIKRTPGEVVPKIINPDLIAELNKAFPNIGTFKPATESDSILVDLAKDKTNFDSTEKDGINVTLEPKNLVIKAFDKLTDRTLFIQLKNISAPVTPIPVPKA